jgi:hypothetical protein
VNFSELLEWQWRDYSSRHRNHANLIIHIVAVPVFWLGAVDFLSALLLSGLLHTLAGALLIGLSLFAQGKGHELEKVQPEPYRDMANHVQRIVAEQFITFPRFVVSGQWYANLRRSGG